ncbi:MAG: flagellar biosynthetic protein FliO [Pseudomonadota bacterium]
MLFEEGARLIFAFVAVLGMIGAAAYIARKVGLGAADQSGAGKKRLSLVETLTVDPRRRIAIIRCDEKEHLIAFGPESETVIERDLNAIPRQSVYRPGASHQLMSWRHDLAGDSDTEQKETTNIETVAGEHEGPLMRLARFARNTSLFSKAS